jgi:hypothetical protein
MIPIGKPKNQHTVFRHRGFLCVSCNETLMAFGGDEPSKVCMDCGAGGELKLLWDHKVSSRVTVEEWATSTPTPEAPAPVEEHPPADTVSDPVST